MLPKDVGSSKVDRRHQSRPLAIFVRIFKEQQISGRIALQCLLYTSKDFVFLPNRCSSAFSLINTKKGKYVGRTCRTDKDFVLERKGIGYILAVSNNRRKKTTSLGDKYKCV